MGIADIQTAHNSLIKKNQELAELYREKSKKHMQITNLYNLLKSRVMRSQIQTAATDSVAHTLESFGPLSHNAAGASTVSSKKPAASVAGRPFTALAHSSGYEGRRPDQRGDTGSKDIERLNLQHSGDISGRGGNGDGDEGHAGGAGHTNPHSALRDAMAMPPPPGRAVTGLGMRRPSIGELRGFLGMYRSNAALCVHLLTVRKITSSWSRCGRNPSVPTPYPTAHTSRSIRWPRVGRGTAKSGSKP